MESLSQALERKKVKDGENIKNYENNRNNLIEQIDVNQSL